MKKILFTCLSFIFALSFVYAQKGINYFGTYAAGGRFNMSVDSGAKNVYYGLIFPNQPSTSFNYLPEVKQVSVQMYFKKTENPANFRYSILVDEDPIEVNKPINKEQLKEVIRKNEDWTDHEWKDLVLDSTTLAVFPIQGKSITILTYDIQRPQNFYKNVFYGKRIPRAKIEIIAKRFATDKGVDYDRILRPKEKIVLTFTEKDDELTIVKDGSDIDYLYSSSIKDKKTGKIIFESSSWLYGGYLNEEGNKLLPYIKVDNSIFKKSGDYEIIIQPHIDWDKCFNCDLTAQEIEESISRYTLTITLEDQHYTIKELMLFALLIITVLGIAFMVILYFIKKGNHKKLVETKQQEKMAKLQLNSVRSQLNPHFLFNALSGIQNLINKNEVDHANTYLVKFARLTRAVLEQKEFIGLLEEKKLLDDYLQMEQLRFGFTYQIINSEGLELDNIEIPSMLLQPFVENAVKHGVAVKSGDGNIEISFIKKGNDLLLKVSDNGQGFDTSKEFTGLGIRLCNARIALLNNLYKENQFILAIHSKSDGTEISIRLTNWL